MRQFVSERFGIELSRSSCLNYLHRLGFVLRRPKKRLLKADEAKREAFIAEYAVLSEEAQRSGAKIFFADEAHIRADAELRGKWVLRGESALVDSSSPRYGEKVQLLLGGLPGDRRGGMDGTGGEQQLRNLSRLPGTTEVHHQHSMGFSQMFHNVDLGQRPGTPWRAGA